MTRSNCSRASMTPSRFWAHALKQPNGCWYWSNVPTQYGYGKVRHEGKQTSAHRVAYMLAVGPIPAGHDVDHKCHNEDESCPGGSTCPHRRCINPDHLQPATRAQNLNAGRGPSAVRRHWTAYRAGPHYLKGRKQPNSPNARKQECARGHPFDTVNTYIIPQGRRCRTCRREAQRRFKARHR